jgi:FAD/FMN-containing dehydrogenase
MLNVRKLQQEVQSEVLFDPVSRSIYSFDASLYELTPAAIILPRSVDDIQKSLLFAKKNNLSITPRGAGTNTAGSCLGSGIILDFSRHLNHIVQFDMANKRITVQPGITLDEINHFLEPYQLQIGPDVSTSDRATIGGMLACNAAGMRSLQYGSMRDAVRSIRMISADGQVIDSRTTTCFDILKNHYSHQHKEAIQRLFPRFGRISSGYYLPAVLENRLERLIAGSEGTLGIWSKNQLIPTSTLSLLSQSSRRLKAYPSFYNSTQRQ